MAVCVTEPRKLASRYRERTTHAATAERYESHPRKRHREDRGVFIELADLPERPTRQLASDEGGQRRCIDDVRERGARKGRTTSSGLGGAGALVAVSLDIFSSESSEKSGKRARGRRSRCGTMSKTMTLESCELEWAE